MGNTEENAIKVLGMGLAFAVGYMVDLIIAEELADGAFEATVENVDQKRKEYYFMLGDSIIDQAIAAMELEDNEVDSLKEFFDFFYGNLNEEVNGDKPEILHN